MRTPCIIESLEVRSLMSANLVADFGGIYPTDSVSSDGISYFEADDGTHGREMWMSDGTIAGTHRIAAIGHDLPDAGDFFSIHGKLLYVKDDPGDQRSLWTSDGTTSGTFELMSIGWEMGGYTPAAVANGDLMFVVHRGATDAESAALWRTDGTAANTNLIEDFPPDEVYGLKSFFPRVIPTDGGTRVVLFNTYEMWSSDGTTTGTINLLDAGLRDNVFEPEYPYGFLEDPTLVGGTLYFDAPSLGEMWRTDGTLENTKEVIHYPSGSEIMQGWAVGSRYFFELSANVDGKWVRTLGVSGGTAASTTILGDFHDVNEVVALNDNPNSPVIIAANTDELGSELWYSDGTAAGTHLLRDFNPGPEGSGAGQLTAVGGLVFFTADDSQTQYLWRTDGTDDGTVRIDQGVGAISSVEGKLAVAKAGETLIYDPSTMTAPVGPHQAYISLTDGVLRIFGTQGDDNIKIYRSLTDADRFVVKLNGIKRSFATADVSRIYIYGYSGNDNIAVDERFGRISIRSRIWGGGGSDFIYTGAGRDTVYGDAGDDTVNSGRNADEVMGGLGDDSIYGGLGNDTVTGDEGADSVNGAGGADMVGGGDDDSTDHLDGGGGADVIFGHAVYEIFYAGKQGSDPSGMDELLLN